MKRKWKRSICALMGVALLSNSFVVRAVAEKEQVKMSDKEYAVSLQDANTIFICNEKPVSGEVGSKVFLTYTVEQATKSNASVNGIIATTDNTAQYPYLENGQMEYDNKSILFEEGYTYLFRFERTNEGFSYQCAKLKDDKVVNIIFPQTKKSGSTEAYQYYGIWTDGIPTEGAGISAMLNHVRCYDEKGNDLGLHFSKPNGTLQNEANALLDVHLTVRTHYSFQTEDLSTVAIGNKYPTDSDVVYMEYEVEDVTLDNTTQQGAMVTRSLSSGTGYPHGGGNGFLRLKSFTQDAEDKLLLREGAKYFICFSKTDETFEVLVQCTINGTTETFSFPSTYGEYDPNFSYFAIWLGDGSSNTFSASFKNFKCYDAEGNNLGLQLTKDNTTISLHGEIEDYSKSKAVYYCNENNGFIVLADEQNATKQDGAKQQNCTYKIVDEENLYLYFSEGKETYQYTSLTITDKDDMVYKRMKKTKVTFVTGEERFASEVQAANGYRVIEPEKPQKENLTFKGWYLGDGTAFDFDTVITDSITLYAKWQDGDGNEYLQLESVSNHSHGIIAIAVSCVVLVGSIIGGIGIARKGKKRDED